MSVVKTITLTDKGNAAGPYYQVSCSNDCVTFGPCITTGSIYLPTIGSTSDVTIYDTTQCIKLVNYNAECNNSIVKSFAASGSTTTTTIAPTTSTTTFSSNPCACMEITITSNGGGWDIFDCYGNNQSYGVTAAGTYNTCVAVVGGLPQITITSGTGTYVQVGNCKTGTCPPTPTTTTTSTTTCAPLYYYNVTNFGPGVLSFSYINNTYTNIDDTISPVYPAAGSTKTLCMIQGSWNKIGGNGTATQGSSCGTVCPTTTTTSTTTTTTTTTLAPPFVGSVGYGTTAYEACNGPISTFTMTGNGTTFCNSTTFTAVQWNAVATGNYVIAYGGNTMNVSHTFGTPTATVYGGGCQVCSAATTTTTTAGPAYDFYLADEYSCFPCTLSRTDVLVAFPAGTSYIGTHYYSDIGHTGFVYKITSSTTSGVAIILDTLGNSTNCNSVCSV